MSDTFVIAARIHMEREDFEAWLAAPAPGLAAIANLGEMFTGWFWDGKPNDLKDWERHAGGTTPRQFFARRVERSCAYEAPLMSVLRYRDRALEAYFIQQGYNTDQVHTGLLLLAGAAAYKTDSSDDLVLFWAEAGGLLLDADDKGWLSVMAVSADGARFVQRNGTGDRESVSPAALAAAIQPLTQAQESLHDMNAVMLDDQTACLRAGTPLRSEAPGLPLYVDPAILR